jgi:hypothetical protein
VLARCPRFLLEGAKDVHRLRELRDEEHPVGNPPALVRHHTEFIGARAHLFHRFEVGGRTTVLHEPEQKTDLAPCRAREVQEITVRRPDPGDRLFDLWYSEHILDSDNSEVGRDWAEANPLAGRGCFSRMRAAAQPACANSIHFRAGAILLVANW